MNPIDKCVDWAEPW